MSSVGNESFTACNNTLHPSVRDAGRGILVSSRLGARVESSVNMNEQAHDNMSASHGRCGNVTAEVFVRSRLLVRSA